MQFPSIVSFFGYFSDEIHAYEMIIVASRWSTLLEIADLSRYVSVCKGELTFITMGNVSSIFVFIAFSVRVYKKMNNLDKMLSSFTGLFLGLLWSNALCGYCQSELAIVS